jgi:hypothetical protein
VAGEVGVGARFAPAGRGEAGRGGAGRCWVGGSTGRTEAERDDLHEEERDGPHLPAVVDVHGAHRPADHHRDGDAHCAHLRARRKSQRERKERSAGGVGGGGRGGGLSPPRWT